MNTTGGKPRPAVPAGGPGASSVLDMRRRSVWEAADSGILLWRLNFLYYIPFFALPVWIVASALMFIPEDFRWVSWLALWWLKPLFDRLCLHITALRFFRRAPDASYDSADIYDSSPAGLRAMLKGMDGMTLRGLPGDLLWRRFSPIRSAAMPLRLLEKPLKKHYEERKKVLASGGLYFCAFLSILGPLIEAFLLGGEYIFARIFFELFFPSASWSLSFSMVDTTLFIFSAYTFNYILVESLYVCMGFGIYINCRTEVEGWDIQLLFRKFTGKTGAAGKAALLGLVLVLFALPLNADDAPDIPQAIGDSEEPAGSEEPGELEEPIVNLPPGFLPVESIPHEELQEILSSDDFGGMKPGWTIRQKNQEEPSPPPQIDFAPWLERLKEILAFGLRALIVLIIAGFSVFLLVKYLEFRRSAEKGRKRNANAYINPLLTEEDPETYFSRAEDFFYRGLLREAWAACLCGTIGSYGRYPELNFPPDSTEYGCLEIVRGYFAHEDIPQNPTAGFEELVRNWVFLAYGGRNPPEGSFEKALSFGRSLKTMETPVSGTAVQGAALA